MRALPSLSFSERRVAKKYLKQAGIENAAAFLKTRFVQISIGKKHFLLCPRGLDPSRPIRELCLLVHEAHHIDQKAGNQLEFLYRYLNRYDRVHIEAEGYASEEPVRNVWGFSKANRTFEDDWAEIYCVGPGPLNQMNDKHKQLIDAAYCPPAAQKMIEIIEGVMG